MFTTIYELTLEIVIKKLISHALFWKKLGHYFLNAILSSKKGLSFTLLKTRMLLNKDW